MLEEWRNCDCPHCSMDYHWFPVGEMGREKAEKIVESNNRVLLRLHGS